MPEDEETKPVLYVVGTKKRVDTALRDLREIRGSILDGLDVG